MKIVALVGEPGAGKSTITKGILSRLCERFKTGRFTFGKLNGHVFRDGPRAVYVLGTYSGEAFSGTDKLSMAVQPDAERFMGSLKSEDVVFFEGDRLGTQSFLNFLKGCGELKVLVLKNSRAPEFRARRGSSQNEVWLKGRLTKVAGIEANFEHEVITNEVDGSVDTQVGIILSHLK